MKTAPSKTNSEPTHHGSPNKENSSFFSNDKSKETSFFSPAFIQPKLKIGAPDDPYEREADRVANQVMKMPDPSIQMFGDEEEELQMRRDPAIQMKCESCKHEEELQRKPIVQRKADGSQVASNNVSQKINSTKGTGHPLPKKTQQEMGKKMGADFSGVNVHTDNTAVQLSQDLGARAFTVGSDIYFNKGQYNPNSNEGKRLMAHELAHTVQQGKMNTYPTPNIQRQLGLQELDGDGRLHSVEIHWSENLRRLTRNADSNFNPSVTQQIKVDLKSEFELLKNSLQDLYQDYIGWAADESRELLEEFQMQMPNIIDFLFDEAMDETRGAVIGAIAEKHPILKVLSIISKLALKHTEMSIEAEMNNEQVARNVEESEVIFRGLGGLLNMTNEAALNAVFDWVGNCMYLLGRVDQAYTEIDVYNNRIETYLEQEYSDDSTPVVELRNQLISHNRNMSNLFRLASGMVDGLSNSIRKIEDDGQRALIAFEALFNQWQALRRNYENFDRNRAIRHFYWHPETNQLIEITGDKVRPEPVLLASSPLSSSRSQTFNRNEENRPWAINFLTQAEEHEVMWGRELNSNFPIQSETLSNRGDVVDTDSEYVRLFTYVGLWPDGGFHIMRKISRSPYHANVDEGQTLSWEPGLLNHPAMKSLFTFFPPSDTSLARAAGIYEESE